MKQLMMAFFGFLRNQTQRNPMKVSLVFVPVLFSILLLFVDVQYETIDDFFMNTIASGYIGGTPDEHLIYSNVIIGLFLKGLYTYVPGLNWYGLYLVGAHITGWVILTYVFLQSARLNYAGVALFYIFLVFELVFIQKLQFTTTTALLSTSGLLLFLNEWRSAMPSKKMLVFAACVIIFSGMIRLWSLALCALMIGPFFLLIPGRKAFLKASGLILAIGAMSWILNAISDAHYHRTREWSTYITDFRTSDNFNDNPYFYETFIEPEKGPESVVGWSKNDLNLFTSFFREYEPVFNSVNYEILYTYLDHPVNIQKNLRGVITKFINIHLILILLMALVFLKWKRSAVALLSLMLVIGFCALIVYPKFVFKERVTISIFFTLITLIFWLVFKNEREGNLTLPGWIGTTRINPLFALVVLLIVAAGLNSGIKLFRTTWDSNHAKEKLFSSQLKLIDDPQKCYVIMGGLINFEVSGPFSNHYVPNAQPVIYPISAFNKSPLMKGTTGKFGFQTILEAIPSPEFEMISSGNTATGFSPEGLKEFYRVRLNRNLIILKDSVDTSTGLRTFSFNEVGND